VLDVGHAETNKYANVCLFPLLHAGTYGHHRSVLNVGHAETHNYKQTCASFL